MKDERLFVRMTTELRNRVRRAAEERGEAESVIVREALNQYFETHAPLGKPDAALAVSPVPRSAIDRLNERSTASPLPAPQPTTYRKRKPRKP